MYYLHVSVWHSLLEELAAFEPCRAAAYARGLIYLTDRDTIPYWGPLPIDSSIVQRSVIYGTEANSFELTGNSPISISPNPVGSEFTFMYPASKNQINSMTIFTSDGIPIYKITLKNGPLHQLNISDWKPGLYIGIISNSVSSSIETFKIVKL